MCNLRGFSRNFFNDKPVAHNKLHNTVEISEDLNKYLFRLKLTNFLITCGLTWLRYWYTFYGLIVVGTAIYENIVLFF